MVAVYMLFLGGCRASYRNHAPPTRYASHSVRPPPLWGRAGEGGDAVMHGRCLTQPPPPLTPPQKGGERRELSLAPLSLPGLTRQSIRFARSRAKNDGPAGQARG